MFLLRGFFLRGDFRVFSGGFGEIGRAERGFCVVNRGGFVVKEWLETAANRTLKNMPSF